MDSAEAHLRGCPEPTLRSGHSAFTERFGGKKMAGPNAGGYLNRNQHPRQSCYVLQKQPLNKRLLMSQPRSDDV